ncbi:MAG: COX15/CtaA family protein [Chloroflexi bacterium]|nr:COX15/CtaA family protein [Chloroflexota bacterium]
MRVTRFAAYTWGTVILNLLVILWGGYVRATGSGAGCGSHWPLCNGEVAPRAPAVETVIELTHRVTSGLAFLVLIGLLVWALKIYPPGHRARRGAALAMVFMVSEALIGAGLVLFEWVAMDASLGRAIAIVVHLVNTFLLLACLILTAYWAKESDRAARGWNGKKALLIGISVAGSLVLGASGALTALGDTLFPAESLAAGLQQDFSSAAHFLVRLRLLHPLIALIVGGGLIFAARKALANSRLLGVRRAAYTLIGLVLAQWAAGVVNLLLLAPVWMQIVHLLLADLVWCALVFFVAVWMDSEQPQGYGL